jgi:hypothetical protein
LHALVVQQNVALANFVCEFNTSFANLILSKGTVVLGLAAVFNASVALTDMGIYG